MTDVSYAFSVMIALCPCGLSAKEKYVIAAVKYWNLFETHVESLALLIFSFQLRVS